MAASPVVQEVAAGGLNHSAVQHVERRKQGRGATALAIAAARPFFIGRQTGFGERVWLLARSPFLIGARSQVRAV